jgi:hypothetical protein
MTAHARFFQVENRLAPALKKRGGLVRDTAIANATSGVENLRDDFTASLLSEIAATESIIHWQGGPIGDGTLLEIESRTKAIYNLAATFGFASLSDVAASLLDLIVLMKPSHLRCVGPIAVHVQALRFASGNSGQMPAPGAGALLNELKKVTAHFRFCDANGVTRSVSSPDGNI